MHERGKTMRGAIRDRLFQNALKLDFNLKGQ